MTGGKVGAPLIRCLWSTAQNRVDDKNLHNAYETWLKSAPIIAFSVAIVFKFAL